MRTAHPERARTLVTTTSYENDLAELIRMHRPSEAILALLRERHPNDAEGQFKILRLFQAMTGSIPTSRSLAVH